MGIVTSWDIAKAVAASFLWLDEIMSRNVVTTTPDESIEDAARKMEDHEISALPVIDGAAITHKQSREDRPRVEIPEVENLFLAGDGTATPGVSGEIAVASGILAAEKVAGYLGGKLI